MKKPSNTGKPHGNGNNHRKGGKGGKYFNNKRDGFTPKPKDGEGKDDGVKDEEKTNNPAWYMTNPALTNGVASIPFNVPLGDTVSMADISGLQFEDGFENTFGDTRQAFPGIVVIDLIPAFGQQVDASSSLNTAAQANFTWTRYKISGSRKYTPSDEMIYLLANGQVYSAINWAMRIYGTIKLFDYRNKYMSRRILQAMRVNYDDFVGRLAEYRGRLNLLIEKAASFVVPKTMTYFERISSVYTDIYTDGESVKDQMYMYNPDGFYWFTFDTSEEPSHPGAYLKYHQLYSQTHLLSVDEVIGYLNDMIDALFYANDQGTISGDLFKAYEGNVINLGSMAEDYTTNIVQDEWVLNQMKNGTAVSAVEFVAPDLYQSTHDYSGNLIYDPTFTVHYDTWNDGVQLNMAVSRGPRLLSVKSKDPQVDHVMEFSRLMTGVKDVQIMLAAHSWKYTVVCGDNVIVRTRMIGFKFWEDGVLRMTEVEHNQGYICNFHPESSDTSYYQRMLNLLVWRRYFPYMPQIYLTWSKGTASYQKNGFIGLSTDVDNYAVIDSATLSHIHEVALMNLFGTDAIAKLS